MNAYTRLHDSRSAVKKTEEHEEFIRLAEAGGHDAKCVRERDGDENLPTTEGVRDGAPGVRAGHHADEDDRVQPSLGLRVEFQITLCTRQYEGHGDHVHLLAGADEAAYREEEVVELAIVCRNKMEPVNNTKVFLFPKYRVSRGTPDELVYNLSFVRDRNILGLQGK